MKNIILIFFIWVIVKIWGNRNLEYDSKFFMKILITIKSWIYIFIRFFDENQIFTTMLFWHKPIEQNVIALSWVTSSESSSVRVSDCVDVKKLQLDVEFKEHLKQFQDVEQHLKQVQDVEQHFKQVTLNSILNR